MNPWVIIGGVASSVCDEADIIMPEGAVAGDVILLTKALGSQVAVNAHQWLEQGGEKWEKIKTVTNPEEVKQAYRETTLAMARLNLTGAKLMHKYNARAATDVTGFGILGHAKNLAENQIKPVSFTLHTLPILKNKAVIMEDLWLLTAHKQFGICRGCSGYLASSS